MTGASDGGSVFLQLYYVLSLQTLWAFGHFEFNAVTFIERLESPALNGAVMYEYIITGITADKTIAFVVVKPLYGSLFFHLFFLTYWPSIEGVCFWFMVSAIIRNFSDIKKAASP